MRLEVNENHVNKLAAAKRSANILLMKKDTRLTFRVNSNLKKEVEEIATREGQSVARICEAFLLAGSERYKKLGSKFLRPLVGRLGYKGDV
jgi:hypothetical protein